MDAAPPAPIARSRRAGSRYYTTLMVRRGQRPRVLRLSKHEPWPQMQRGPGRSATQGSSIRVCGFRPNRSHSASLPGLTHHVGFTRLGARSKHARTRQARIRLQSFAKKSSTRGSSPRVTTETNPSYRNKLYPPGPQRQPADGGHSLLSKLQNARPADFGPSLAAQRIPAFEPGTHSCAPSE
jgi:hypothetical protein